MQACCIDVRLSRRSRIEEMPAEQAYFLAREHFFSRCRGPSLTVATFVALLERGIAGGHEEAAWMLGLMKRTRHSSQHDLPAIVTRMKELLTSARNKDKSPRGLYHSIKDLKSRLADVDVRRLRAAAEGGYEKCWFADSALTHAL